ncbi:hypothetical protein VIGAN_01053100 [Vigna angularis var. angularis]|uniref:Uncharacterized protein n=1 Tax=Vigna angularis var. angularis TaxID=157739 RepID=A0A0S3QXL4_PHAAN|nr:hypothetical protein VIGAN_01053100 [Vigna angularis var. angularis]
MVSKRDLETKFTNYTNTQSLPVIRFYGTKTSPTHQKFYTKNLMDESTFPSLSKQSPYISLSTISYPRNPPT